MKDLEFIPPKTGTLTCHEFLDGIAGRHLIYFQTDLYDMTQRRCLEVIPTELSKCNDGGGSVTFGGCVYLYDADDALYSCLSGVYIAVKRPPAGALICDRFVPVMMLLDEYQQIFNPTLPFVTQ